MSKIFTDFVPDGSFDYRKKNILAIPISSKVNTLIITVVIRRNNRH